MEDLTGHEFGPYRIVAPCGEGGMAAVFKAYQASMDRYVAVKVLPRYFASDKRFLGRFDQEAKVLARLQHPYILPVHDYGEHDGYTYIVMPLVETGSLADMLHDRPLSLGLVDRLISQVADALDYAHSVGVVHRDVKPSNILVDARGNSLLTDFGIAKIVQSAASFTQTGGILGTPAYMSPEQILGEPLDGRSDIYSLGIVLYEMVTGRPPFKAETPAAIFVKHLHDPLPLPRQFLADLPEPIERVILKALAKKREARFQTADELAAALSAAIAGRSDALAAMSPDLVPPPSTELGVPSEVWKRPERPAAEPAMPVAPTPAGRPATPPPAPIQALREATPLPPDTSVPTLMEPPAAMPTPPASVPSPQTPPPAARPITPTPAPPAQAEAPSQPAATPAGAIPSYVAPADWPPTPPPARPATDEATAIATGPAAARPIPVPAPAPPIQRLAPAPSAAELADRVTPAPTPPHLAHPAADLAAERPAGRRGVPAWIWGLGALVLVAIIAGAILAGGNRQEPAPTAQPAPLAAAATAPAARSATDTPEPENIVERAFARLDSGAHAEALALFDQALAAEIESPDLYTGRAAACIALAEAKGGCDPLHALADVDRAIELDPDFAWAHNMRGHIFRHLGDPAAAGPDLRRSVELAPEEPGFRAERAWYYAETGQYDAALADWDVVISQVPEEPWPWIGRGWANVEAGDPDAAIRDLSKAIELDPTNGEPHSIRARAWDQLGEYQRQLEDLNAAIELQPENPSFYSDRAWWYTSNENREAAIADWQRAIELDPGYASFWTEIGWRLYEMGDYQNALEHFEEAIHLAPDDLNPRFGKARAIEGTGDLEAAINEWNWILLAYPENTEALTARAQVNSQAGETEKAIADLRRAVELEPQNPGFHIDLGWQLYNSNQLDEAQEQFEQAVSIAPDDPRMHEQLAWFYNGTDRPDAAIAAMSQAIAADPDSAEFWQNRGWIRLWNGELELARTDFATALERDPENPWAAKGMGIYYRDSGASLELSLEHLNQAVEVRPDDPGMYFERAMTYMQLGQPSSAADDLSIAMDLLAEPREWAELWAHRAQAYDALGEIDAARADYLTFMDLIMGRAEPYWLEWLHEAERWLVAHPAP